MDSRRAIRTILNEARGLTFNVMKAPWGGLTLRAYLAGEEVGHVTTETLDETRSHLGNLYVKPDHRGRGYGTLLAQKAAQSLKEWGVKVVEADVTSQKSYRALVSAFGTPSATAFESIDEIPATSYHDVDGEGKPGDGWAVAWNIQ